MRRIIQLYHKSGPETLHLDWFRVHKMLIIEIQLNIAFLSHSLRLPSPNPENSDKGFIIASKTETKFG